MTSDSTWNSPRIRNLVASDDKMTWKVRAKVDELAACDAPSTSDTAMIFQRYNSGGPAERDAIDAAFVWMTGYTLATICAMVVTLDGKDYERTLKNWRRARS